MKQKLLLMMGLVAALTSCSSDEPATISGIELSTTEEWMVDGEKNIAFTVFNNMATATPNENTLIAPMSIYSAVSMLANDADASEQLANQLCAKDIQSLNEFNSKMMRSLPLLDGSTQFISANSAWVVPEYDFNPTFAQSISAYYQAALIKAPIKTMQGVDQINQWCATNTRGLITRPLDGPIDSDVTLCNINYFKGIWADKFDAKNTKDETFHGTKGDQTVKMMSKDGGYSSAIVGGVSYARMLYGNGTYRITIALPAKDVAITDFAKNFTNSTWAEVQRAYFTEKQFPIIMPRFKISTTGSIGSHLVKAVPGMMGSFNGIINQPVIVKQVIHGVAIEVNEEGTEGAGFTGIVDALAPSGSVDNKFRVDRPFVFVIDEVNTGLILFMGLITNI